MGVINLRAGHIGPGTSSDSADICDILESTLLDTVMVADKLPR